MSSEKPLAQVWVRKETLAALTAQARREGVSVARLADTLIAQGLADTKAVDELIEQAKQGIADTKPRKPRFRLR